MGYRWYKGRLLSDAEYADVVQEESNNFWFSIGFLIPTVILGYIGYQYSTTAMWVGIVLGSIIGVVLNRLILFVSIIVILIAIVVAFFKSKSEKEEVQTSQNAGNYLYVSSAKGANLRSEPSIGADKVVTLRQGSPLLFLNDSIFADNNKWYKVSSNGKIAWISAALVTYQ
jgi:uncharacterized membrane protein